MRFHVHISHRIAYFIGLCATILSFTSTARAGGDLVTVVDGIQSITTENFTVSSPDVADGCITPGVHRVMRFNFRSRNIGDADVVAGVAPAPLCTPAQCSTNTCNKGGQRNGAFVWSDGHCHWHVFEFNKYNVMNASQATVGTGFKQAFCLMDVTKVDPSAPPAKFNCSNQGVTNGWEDVYGSSLPCQFMNMDGIGNGKYRLVSTTNASRVISEARYDNNTTVNVINISGNTVTPAGGDWLRDTGASDSVHSTPAVASWGPGRADTFWVTNGGVLKHGWREGAASGSDSLGKPSGVTLVGEASVASWGPNRLDIFARGSDNQMWHTFWDNGWGGWEALGFAGFAASSPTVVSWGSNRLDIFWINGSLGITHVSWAPGWFVDTHPGPGGGDGLVAGSVPVASSFAYGRLDVFARTSNNHLWWISWNGGWSAAYAFTTGNVASRPAVTSWGINRLDLVWMTTGGEVGHGSLNGGSFLFDNLGKPPGHTLTQRPTVVSWGFNRVDVFVPVVDGRLFHRAWAPGWGLWETASIPLNEVGTPPSAVSWGTGQFDVYFGNQSQGLNRQGFW